MKPFTAPIDDILFSLNYVAGAEQIAKWDTAEAAEIASYFAGFAESEIAPLDEPGDRQGCHIKDGRVFMPDGFAEAYRDYADQGWPGMCAPVEFGGQGLSELTQAITSEIFSGANHSFQMVVGLVPGAVRTILRFGSEAQKNTYVPKLTSGSMIASMCLTEPAAGSDLSRVQCKAKRDDEHWSIDGEKIFISGGDQNLSDSRLHLVLARTSEERLKGLSLFLCPSTKTSGEPNSVSVARLEEKMGLHASPTCHLIFDQAQAELVGEEGRGLAAMFTMMNHARIDVALQGVAHAARAHDIANTYAEQRVQGRNKEGQPTTLDQHEDVRRMLDEIDWLALSSRGVAHLAAVALQKGEVELAEFLTPVAKVYCSQSGIRAAELGMQVLGGYGYLREYRIEQTYRDARITAIYEGANGIHERALATRLARSTAGDAFQAFLNAEIDCNPSDELAKAVKAWTESQQLVAVADSAERYAHQYMQTTIEAVLSIVRERLSENAQRHPNPQRIERVCKQAAMENTP